MKNIILILTLALGLSSCAEHERKEFLIADAQLQTAYDYFITAAKIRNQSVATNNLIIKFGEITDPEVVAYCHYKISTGTFPDYTHQYTPEVVFDVEYKGADQVFINQIMMHELGHCLLNKKHTRTDISYVNAAGYIKSVMFPYMVSLIYGKDLYLLLENYYFDELFNPNTPAIDPYTQQIVPGKISVNSKLAQDEDDTEFDKTIVYISKKNGTCLERKNQ